MNLWQPFSRNEIDVLFYLRDCWFPILFKGDELPCVYFALQLRPILQHIRTAIGLCIDHLTRRRYSQSETKFVKALTHAMQLDLLCSSSVVIE